ncbi:hypothetical protein J0383_09110 [Flavobacterium endoglycinae]|uniref:Uncharacterized protein n=1 Tax=Flavobacterium endoglycinae TaxID=2816357 RepID=A0ABX7QIQ3_9FLAO|nr:hypothetical protein [Flavobacterium endoglycinae]QSW90951.1 hypothetical protein J0383_09110 [Flavobacterium endoglycinae]
MKKLLFTVFAVSSISFTASANQLESTKLEAKIIVFADCKQDQADAEALCLEMGCSPYEAYFYGAGVWGRCMGA